MQADNVTISGLDITAYNDPDYNFKTISIIGDNATIKNCSLHNLDQVSSIYMYDPRYNPGTDTSYITSYRFEGNCLDAGGIYASGIRISSGPGWSGSAANRVITGNSFAGGSYGIEFVGPGGDPWDVYPVGAATITGNSFGSAEKGHVAAWGIYAGSEGYGALDWDGIFTGNTFDRAVITKTPGGAVRSYDSGAFKYVRGIYSAIQRYPLNIVAQAGDTINVAAGTYNIADTILVNKEVTISGPTSGGATVQGTGGLLSVFEIASGSVSIQNLEITLDASTPRSSQPTVNEELVTSLIRIPAGTGLTGIAITNNTLYVPAQPGAMSLWGHRAITAGSGTVSGMSITGNTIYNTRNGVVIHYNNTATISNNIIYNTKGGIMQYTGSQTDANNRTMSNNSWGTVHNEWDIVWNSGGGPYAPDYNQSVLVLSGANNDAYVVSLMTPPVP